MIIDTKLNSYLEEVEQNKDFSEWLIDNPFIVAPDKIEAHKKKRDRFRVAQYRYTSIAWDIKNKSFNVPYIKKIYPVEYIKDKSTYAMLSKKPRYLSLETADILKVIYAQKKIRPQEYKKALSRLGSKEQTPKVQGLINAYLSTLKAKTNKNSMSALKRKADKRIKYKLGNYLVILKKKLPYFSNSLVESEFKRRLHNCNKLEDY